jgi:hypothetical protein
LGAERLEQPKKGSVHWWSRRAIIILIRRREKREVDRAFGSHFVFCR